MVSIIVPTRNRSELLREALESLLALDYDHSRLEVIVVDNSSTDNTEDVVKEIERRAPFEVHFYRKENRGPAASRNFGAARANGEIVAFVDSDCRVAPGWLREAITRFDDGVGLVAGPVIPAVNPRRVPSFFSHQVDHSRPNPLFPTANVLYRRDVLESLGGFDERFGAYPWGPPVGGEDTDLAWRAKRAGWRPAFAAAAPVFHEASEIGAAAWLLDPVKKQVMPLMVRRIPELGSELLKLRLFLDWTTAAFDAALISAVVALVSRRRLALLGAAPWVWLLRGWVAPDLWPPSRWWHIPVKYALLTERYLLQAAALVYGSIRHGRPVL
jgi:glycosyltransferase involved in cell wall biosynthesis